MCVADMPVTVNVRVFLCVCVVFNDETFFPLFKKNVFDGFFLRFFFSFFIFYYFYCLIF